MKFSDIEGRTDIRHIRLIVAYDGTELGGYQRQNNAPSVQGYLEDALSRVCGEPITVYGASRTDAGVHAKFQVCTFLTTGRIPADNLTKALIAFLPEYIVIRRAEEIPIVWKPRWNIVGKEYVYTIYNDETEQPLTARYHWHVRKRLDVGAMRTAAEGLVGTHDFTGLKGANSTETDPVKTIYGIDVAEACAAEASGFAGTLRIRVTGDGFLYRMVRNIAGVLVDAGLGGLSPDDVERRLRLKDRCAFGKTAPAQGLCLEEIFFTRERLDEVVRGYESGVLRIR